MKSTLKIGLIAIILLAIAVIVRCEDDPKPLYKPGEIFMEAGATVDSDRDKLSNANGGLFVGVGGYLTENFGARANLTFDEHEPIFDRAEVSLLARVPIKSVAPYATGGVGRDLGIDEVYWFAGAGVELRVMKRLGIFAEGRNNWIPNRPDNPTFLGGLRLSW